ncbi:PREDICTED: NADH dehydrogenase [ubiquinone] 1 beta subcomplex subunit 7-like [Amphimedon queenslandica]|uniref:NADH dehydrogenase [ubiquinone] 1 beta subcomplex subunit 7 n=1 Tax=Amphimedon queenslandica TaxID=400682 RepID=A0A1X7U8Y8_AMPQE|nr:PREDICTED: NADH dehydrogenase [ubiquinone] 1 beta subcomplex subunit 7-like [Amphimedon queenslandica]XP_019858769.1 PREDICTED: NADH dehydrogenase [ubiquinone] 1 beta subcomplex subunit 7-like [Amphimedon queenslandica]|eukprot:XP_011405773.1 PREDICTED: NADH dehydrogenase [ubiquinone] 1 beta subcomplex subunit 7-like [Amphimedon queenslandica]
MATGFKREMKVTQEEMAEAKVPLNLRDYCAHHFIPLMKCRKDNYYLPWRCKKEKHAWDECEFQDYLDRVRQKRQQQAAAAED